MTDSTDRHHSPAPWVLLVHGLAAPRSALWLLAYRLRRQGFRTKIFGYPSIVSGVRQHAERFDRYLQTPRLRFVLPNANVQPCKPCFTISRPAISSNSFKSIAHSPIQHWQAFNILSSDSASANR